MYVFLQSVGLWPFASYIATACSFLQDSVDDITSIISVQATYAFRER